jgi:DNA-directed RNA polymerase subunit RPC12/RpoP
MTKAKRAKTVKTVARKATKAIVTREQFIHGVRALAVARVKDVATRARLLAAKLVYGVGSMSGARGVCYYAAWQNGEAKPVEVLEIAANCEESLVQLAGTTIHEVGHSLAGSGSGHDKEWKEACAALGLNAVQAGGQEYAPEHFDADLWKAIAALAKPTDGTPVFGARRTFVGLPKSAPKPCPMGVGTRGGKSRGAGSGSRMRLWQCPKCEQKIRAASDTLAVRCEPCKKLFVKR